MEHRLVAAYDLVEVVLAMGKRKVGALEKVEADL